jgi:hypothetical protein
VWIELGLVWGAGETRASTELDRVIRIHREEAESNQYSHKKEPMLLLQHRRCELTGTTCPGYVNQGIDISNDLIHVCVSRSVILRSRVRKLLAISSGDAYNLRVEVIDHSYFFLRAGTEGMLSRCGKIGTPGTGSSAMTWRGRGCRCRR